VAAASAVAIPLSQEVKETRRQKMRGRILIVANLAVFLVLFSGGPIVAEEVSKDHQRGDVRKIAQETLSRLYEIQPNAKKAIEKASGYAVFSNFGMKIFFAGGGKGKGIAVNNATKKETFMKMIEVQAGLGIGVKKFRLVWVFEDQKNLSQFINSGWELGGQATAAAKLSDEGGAFAGAMSVSPGVWLYQLTDEGLALELTAKGTKYYKDKDLN
jgi:lipid-binding SYLF domain-containing protein